MKKLTIIIVTLLFAASAPVASAADWKEEILDELNTFMVELGDKLSEKTGRTAPFAEKAFRYNTVSTIVGMCMGFIAEVPNVPATEEFVTLSQEIVGTALRGKEISNEYIHQYGVACLTHIEKAIIAQGVPREHFDKNVVPLLKEQLRGVMRAML